MAVPIPLAYYRTRPDFAGVQIACYYCGYRWIVPLETVIADLVARGVGDETTPIVKVADLGRKLCPRCKGGGQGWRKFQSTPSWKPD